MQYIRFLLVTSTILMGWGSTPAFGQWPLCGVPACVAPNVQYDPQVVPTPAPGAILFWDDWRNGRRDLFGTRLEANGETSPGWPIGGIQLGIDLGTLWRPVGIPDGEGGAIIVWEDHRNFGTAHHDIYAQRVMADGSIAPGWPPDGLPICTAPKDQRRPRIISNGLGGAIITWDDSRDDTTYPLNPTPDIYALSITGSGTVTPGWTPGGTPIGVGPGAQWFASLAQDGAGGAIITWTDQRQMAATGDDIYAVRITHDGAVAPGWPINGIAVIAEPEHQSIPHVVEDRTGGVIISWNDYRLDTEDGDIFAQRITADGQASQGWPQDGLLVVSAPRPQQNVSMIRDGAGGAIICWEDYRSQVTGNSTESDIYVQRITASGTLSPGWPQGGRLVCAATGFQLNHAMTPDGAGGAVIVWEDTRSGTNEDVYAQHVTASGEIAPGWEPDGRPICTNPTSEPAPAVGPGNAGGVIIAWSDLRNGNKDIFADRVLLDGPVPALVSPVSAEFSDEGAVVLWYGRDASSILAIVQRRTKDSDWIDLGTPSDDGADRLRYADSSVAPGESYGYRLSYRTDDVMQFTQEIWIHVPALELAIKGFTPNPAGSRPAVNLTLATANPATLDVLSVTGKRVGSWNLGTRGAGTHLVDLDGRTFRPGVYWLRLTQDDRTVITKGIVAR